MKANICFLLVLLCLSCSSDDDENVDFGDKSVNNLLGTWVNVSKIGYKADKPVGGTRAKTASRTISFGFDNEFYDSYYGDNFVGYIGKYYLSGNTIKAVNTIRQKTIEKTYTILKLSSDSLVARCPYDDDEYDYVINRYYHKTSFNVQPKSLSSESKQFVGKWILSGGKPSGYWYFASNGIVFRGDKSDISSVKYIDVGSWDYDSTSKTLSTTLNYSSYSLIWSVLTVNSEFWTAQELFGSKNAVTFKKIDN